MCLCKEDPGLYSFINQGCLAVDNMDDKEEMRLVEVSNVNRLVKYMYVYSTLETLPSYILIKRYIHKYNLLLN